jgi:hypothetical protein
MGGRQQRLLSPIAVKHRASFQNLIQQVEINCLNSKRLERSEAVERLKRLEPPAKVKTTGIRRVRSARFF